MPLSDREKRQLRIGMIRDRAVDFVYKHGWLGSNIELKGERIRIREYERWPLRIEYWFPYAEPNDPDALLWKIDVRYRDVPVLDMWWSEERKRLIRYETGIMEKYDLIVVPACEGPEMSDDEMRTWVPAIGVVAAVIGLFLLWLFGAMPLPN